MGVVKAAQLVKAVIAKWNDAVPELNPASLLSDRSRLPRLHVLLLWPVLTHIRSTYLPGFRGRRAS